MRSTFLKNVCPKTLPDSKKIHKTVKIIEFGPRIVQIWIRDLSFARFFDPDPSKYLPGPQIPKVGLRPPGARGPGPGRAWAQHAGLIEKPKAYWFQPKAYWFVPKAYWFVPKAYWFQPKAYWFVPKAYWFVPLSLIHI